MTKPTLALITKTQLQPDARPTPRARKRVKTVAVLKAMTILKRARIPVPAALKSMLRRAANRKTGGYRRLVPNAETVAAIMAARRGELTTVGSIDELFADLNADD